MFTQDDIDSVLNRARAAVDALAEEAGSLAAEAAPGGPQAPTAAVRKPHGRAAQPAVCASTPRKIDRILKLRVPVVVKLAECTMSMSDVMKLVPGTIIEFDRNVDCELDLMVNNTQIGTGEAIKVGERFGLRVVYVGDVRQRVQSFGAC